MQPFWFSVILFCAPTVVLAQADSAGPLHRLLQRIPVEAAGLISLSDLDAARHQIAPFAAETPKIDRDILPFMMINPPHGFDVSGLMLFENGAADSLGFSIFDIHQLAGWGDPPEAPVIVTGVADRETRIATALQARGFEITDYNSHTVWHRQDDFEVDFKRRLEEPFGGQIGMSQRFSLDGEDLLFARDWPTMHRLLDSGPSFADDIDSDAILRAGYSLADVGALIDVALISGQPMWRTDTALVVGSGQKPEIGGQQDAHSFMPLFRRYGLLLWQDGATLTGAIAIPYADEPSATMALARFAARLETAEAPSVGRPFAELLPSDRRFEVVKSGGRYVMIAGFRQNVDIAIPLQITTFMRNPHRRLLEMVIYRDLDMLIAVSP